MAQSTVYKPAKPIDKYLNSKLIEKAYSFASPIIKKIFPSSKELREIASKIPLDRILVETDAPFLAPAPFRGKTNEPAYTVYILKTLSEIFSKPVDEIAKLTYNNTLRLFSKIGEYK